MTAADRGVEGLRVTKLERNAEGRWTANVSLNGTTVPVRLHGGWVTATRPERFVLPAVGTVLCAKVRAAERREARREAG